MSGEGGFTWENIKLAFSTGGYMDEQPLLEELGINFGHILSKVIITTTRFEATKGSECVYPIRAKRVLRESSEASVLS